MSQSEFQLFLAEGRFEAWRRLSRDSEEWEVEYRQDRQALTSEPETIPFCTDDELRLTAKDAFASLEAHTPTESY